GGRPGLGRRGEGRGRAARLVVPQRARACGRTPPRLPRLSGDLDRRLPIPARPRRTHRGGYRGVGGGGGASRTEGRGVLLLFGGIGHASPGCFRRTRHGVALPVLLDDRCGAVTATPPSTQSFRLFVRD